MGRKALSEGRLKEAEAFLRYAFEDPSAQIEYSHDYVCTLIKQGKLDLALRFTALYPPPLYYDFFFTLLNEMLLEAHFNLGLYMEDSAFWNL